MTTLSNLHKLLPNHLMELLHSCKSEEDKKRCENSEFSGLERILERHQFPGEINLTPKPSSMPLWRRRQNNNANQGWKKCRLWSKNTKEPPTSTIVVSREAPAHPNTARGLGYHREWQSLAFIPSPPESFSRKHIQRYIFPLSTDFTVSCKLCFY
uniref:Uncharacterized protein n=1 Tax=Moschus moschiferus TaxID=68415 RepID=A0A8C6E7A0_MOSMO